MSSRTEYYQRQLSELNKARDLALAQKSRGIQMLETDVRTADYLIKMADNSLAMAFVLIKMLLDQANDEGIALESQS